MPFVEAMALGDAHTHHDPASRRLLLWSIVRAQLPGVHRAAGDAAAKRHEPARGVGVAGAVRGHGAARHVCQRATRRWRNYSRELMAIVIGIFMHISTTILFESGDVHRINLGKLAAIIFGTGLGILSAMVH